MDGIVSSAFGLAAHPNARVSYVSSSSSAVEALRKDLSSKTIYLVDLGLSPRLAKTINMKEKTRQEVVILDHHQQSGHYEEQFGPHVQLVVEEGIAAATVAYKYFGLNGNHGHLAAIADLVEYCRSPYLNEAEEAWGRERIEMEADYLDFSWRLSIEDDRFRLLASRKLAKGFWPSEIDEVKRRYLCMINENRWARATERVKSRMVVNGEVAVLNFGKRKPSLLGFGTRALTSVAREAGCSVALLINRRKKLSSVALRGIGDPPINLGKFVEEFTQQHGLVGGGHPSSAGAKIHTADVPLLLKEIMALC
ncbi:MAG: DHH family phosphoesterase [Euryarchaeota archaeon]|nr:DHH family phosphoesterase [Euryarchaeota archaeon]